MQWIGYGRLGSTITNMCTRWWNDQYISARWRGKQHQKKHWKHVKMSSSRRYELSICSIRKRLNEMCRWWVDEDGTEKHMWTWNRSSSTWLVTFSSSSNSTPLFSCLHLCSKLLSYVKESNPSDGKRWIVRRCEIGRSWYVCFSFADATTFDWTLLDVQPWFYLHEMLGSPDIDGLVDGRVVWFRPLNGVLSTASWKPLWFTLYDILPSRNCLDVLSVNSILIRHEGQGVSPCLKRSFPRCPTLNSWWCRCDRDHVQRMQLLHSCCLQWRNPAPQNVCVSRSV